MDESTFELRRSLNFIQYKYAVACCRVGGDRLGAKLKTVIFDGVSGIGKDGQALHLCHSLPQ